jgi:two-component system NarL family sensor kinase
VLVTNHREELECRVELGDGPHWFEVRVNPAVRRRRGARTLCLLVQDITLQKVAQDEERRRIAIELHDSTAQNLVALRMNLSRIKSAAALSDSLREMLDSSIEFADASLQEVRTLSYLLHPPLVEEAGLAAALRRYAAGFTERSGIQVKVEIAEDLGRLWRDVETAVFRIVQEALTNAHRHSGSPAVRIGLARFDGNLELDISDQGCGMPPPGPPGEGGLWPRLGVGLAAMRERVEHLDGTLEISSAPGEGTTIQVRLPFGETP